MPDFTYDAPLPAGPIDGFLQTIRLQDVGKIIGTAKWYIAGDGSDGVVQLLELSTATTHRRAGHSSPTCHNGSLQTFGFLYTMPKACCSRSSCGTGTLRTAAMRARKVRNEKPNVRKYLTPDQARAWLGS